MFVQKLGERVSAFNEWWLFVIFSRFQQMDKATDTRVGSWVMVECQEDIC